MSAGPAPTTWSTLTSPPRAQFRHWRELICEAFLALTPESDLRDGFVGQVSQWAFGEQSIARISSQRQRVRRTDVDIDRSPQGGYYANLQLRGTSLMVQDGHTAVLRPGDLAVVDTTRPFTFQFGDDFQQLSFYLPALDADAAGPTATRINTTTGVGAAVRHAFETLVRADLAPATATRLARHTAGLVGVALAQPFELPPAGRPGHRHAAAVTDIAEHLGDHDLGPAATARRLGISVRLLHATFAGREHSYAAEVRRRRLEVARRELQDPRQRDRRIIDIAVDAGFVSVATFHRAFRAQFHTTPSEIRATAPDPRPS